MSCFPGKLNEYRFLSIDRFDGDNLRSWAYFLSHCHTDHMVGLDSDEFRYRINSHSLIQLYCSEVTKALLVADGRYEYLNKKITALAIEDPKVLEVRDHAGNIFAVTVSLLPAAHCPGSVMFLFEGDEGNVLYTGDFRLPKGSAARMKCLHSANGVKKIIKSLYVDTTFCIPNAVYIPSREDCLEQLSRIVTDWFSKGNSNVVRLNISAKYGYEYLFHALSEKFKMKIFCSRKHLYQCLPDTYKILTNDINNSKIFACFKKEKLGKKQQWKSADENFELPKLRKMLVLTLSTLYFTYAAQPQEVCKRIGKNYYRLCFSFHSSHSEVCDFVRYIHPMNVYANVCPSGNTTLKKVEERLRNDCLLPHDPEETRSQFKPLGKPLITHPHITDGSEGSKRQRKRVISLGSTDDDEESGDFWAKFAEKNSKKCTRREEAGCSNLSSKKLLKDSTDNFQNEVDSMNALNDKHGESNISSNLALENDFVTVRSSPESERPSKNEIDELHIKIALNYRKPFLK